MSWRDSIVMRIRHSFGFLIVSLWVLFSTDKMLVEVLDTVASKFKKFQGASARIDAGEDVDLS
jgi:hypothetical protein